MLLAQTLLSCCMQKSSRYPKVYARNRFRWAALADLLEPWNFRHQIHPHLYRGPDGKYPIFIFPASPVSKLTPELLKDSVKAFCDALLNEPGLSKRRMFSVFSVDLVAEAFADACETHKYQAHRGTVLCCDLFR
ncbi:hypothetical protein M405DRAFT_499599 [Rhizopogon salebrosus TDB-379]|nr:hypothetical protein M405DRAFT_499599 [Rhizopogon salebrosus TDB-379]